MKNRVDLISGFIAFATLALLGGKAGAQTVDTVCYGTAPAQFLSVSAASGSLGDSSYIYEWQDSIAGGSWSQAPGINGDTAYQAPALSETTYYRRKVRVLICLEEAYSNVIQVVVLDSLNVSFSGVGNANCSNSEDGSATANVSGGLPPYSYAWDNGETTAAADGLLPGLRSVTVTDAKGCEAVATVDIQYNNEAPSFTFNSDTIFVASEFGTLAGPGGYAGYLWSNGSTDSVTTITSEGMYSLTVTDSSGCSDSDSVHVVLTVGLADAETAPSASVYPNPARQEVNVRIGETHVPDRVEIRTLEGRMIQVEVNRSRINLSGLSAGMYLLDIHRGNRLWRERLIVQ